MRFEYIKHDQRVLEPYDLGCVGVLREAGRCRCCSAEAPALACAGVMLAPRAIEKDSLASSVPQFSIS